MILKYYSFEPLRHHNWVSHKISILKSFLVLNGAGIECFYISYWLNYPFIYPSLYLNDMFEICHKNRTDKREEKLVISFWKYSAWHTVGTKWIVPDWMNTCVYSKLLSSVEKMMCFQSLYIEAECNDRDFKLPGMCEKFYSAKCRTSNKF